MANMFWPISPVIVQFMMGLLMGAKRGLEIPRLGSFQFRSWFTFVAYRLLFETGPTWGSATNISVIKMSCKSRVVI